ncbi:MAG: hypothetical protein AB7F99_13265 [Vicinamibacterales bacterium]
MRSDGVEHRATQFRTVFGLKRSPQTVHVQLGGILKLIVSPFTATDHG